ncbi:T9SS type A sorting domain-containing protein [Aureivirga sp. CE67]|uniref:T9SS type A sorting domain-containing protein n=1 Tax=Aureivirga sp. CE67 TaxID=1788983 RepID=UPI0018C92DF1|nr:T9SS type A sorting domain-containing protein [Aureivirga sp. CE67]
MAKILLKLLCFLIFFNFLKINAQSPRNAVSFDGVNDYIQTERIKGEYHTIEFWVKFDTHVDGVNNTWGNPVITFDSDQGRHKWIWDNKCCSGSWSNEEKLTIANGNHNGANGGNGGLTYYKGETISSEWHHIAIVSDKDPNLPIENVNADGNSYVSPYIYSKMYIDGVEVELFKRSGGASVYKGREVFFAKRGVPADDYHELKFDEFRIWSVPRTQEQIRENMTKKLQGSETGLLAYYQFDEPTGTSIIPDVTGNYDATLYNSNDGTFGIISSGAPIGDESTYLYTSNFSGQSLQLASATGNIKIDDFSGSFSGVHLYKVSDIPTSYDGMYSYYTDNVNYYGVFLVGNNSGASYDIEYDYSMYATALNNQSLIDLYIKPDNSISYWGITNSFTDIGINTLKKDVLYGRSEIILGGRLSSTSFVGKGPGGVGNINGSSSLRMWLDAFNRLGINQESNQEQEAEFWRDKSGFLSDYIQPDADFKPNYKLNNSFNGYPYLRFDGDDILRTVQDVSFNEGQIYVVLRGEDNSGDISKIISNDVTSLNFYKEGFLTGIKRPSFTSNGTNYYATSSTTELNTKTIISFSKTTTSSYRFKYARNDNTEDTVSFSYLASNESIPLQNIGELFKGNIAEILLYDSPLNDTQDIIVKNYLSGKYAYSLDSEDFYLMDNPSKGNFDHHIAGIGRVSNSDNHTLSVGTGILQVSNPSSLGNNEFLFWGSNKQSINDLKLELDTNDYKTNLNSIWRVSEIGNVGTVDLSFDFSTIDLSDFDSSCQEMKLLVSENSDFSGGTVYNLTKNESSFNVSNVSFIDEDYFKVYFVNLIAWNGNSFKNGSAINGAPNMSDSCYKFMVDSQSPSGMTATLTENATIKELEVKEDNILVIEDGVVLYIEEGLILEGEIRLIGDAQIIQKHDGTSKVSGNGVLYRQRSLEHPTKFTVQYLSSPVVDVVNNNHDVKNILKTGGDYSILNGYEGITATSTHPDYAYTTSPYNADTSPTLSDYWFWKFINGSTYNDWQFIRNAGINVNPGEGFSIKGTGREELFVFVGKPNDGTYSTIISADNESLLGNPYPSAIDAYAFIRANTDITSNPDNNLSKKSINGTIYFWDHVSATSHELSDYEGGYATLNLLGGVVATHINNSSENLTGGKVPKRYIPVGQGFFVKGSATGGNIVFNNSQRIFKTESSNESTLLRNSENETSLLKLSFGHFKENGNIGLRQIAVGFKEGLTFGEDLGYDSELIDEKSNDFYWKFNQSEKKFVIAGVEEFYLDIELPLTVKAEKNGVYQFILDEKNNIDAKVFLKDVETGMSYELENEPFEYIIDEGVYEDRFSIIFKPKENLDIDDEVKSEIKMYYADSTNEIVIRSKEKIDHLKIYNTMGQLVFEKSNTMVQDEIRVKIPATISSGVYILNVFTNNKVENLKFRIK